MDDAPNVTTLFSDNRPGGFDMLLIHRSSTNLSPAGAVIARLSIAVLWGISLTFSAPANAQDVIFIIRHAERDFADPDGGLVEEGRSRAAAWADVFAEAEIDLIITSEKARTIETAKPISEALQIPSIALSRALPTHLIEFMATQHADDRVLIVSHSSSIPTILEKLGYAEPVYISADDYDDLFVVQRTADKGLSVVHFNVD